MNGPPEWQLQQTRRQLFGKTSAGIGTAALASLGSPRLLQADSTAESQSGSVSHYPPRAKRVIFLHMSGGPSHIDLLDYKPQLKSLHGEELPASVRGTQRITGMTSGQSSLPIVSSPFRFGRHGQSGTYISELLPCTAKIADNIAVVTSVQTDAINHDPAITFIQTGTQQLGRPSMGSWLSYGLGSENQNLPAFMVLISQGSAARSPQPLFDRLWGSGFLPSNYQGVKLRPGRDPVLYLSNPPGISGRRRRLILDGVRHLNTMRLEKFLDPEINTRIAQYEMAFRMQTSVPELTDVSKETAATFDSYGPESRTPGTFAANCLLARRLAERGLRFIQLYHRNWDHHFNLPSEIVSQAKDVDQASAALIQDLSERGLLDDTLVIWAGEFGRTVYCQGTLTSDNFGRDHHGRCFSIWLAGGGIRPGITFGKTDDFSYNIVRDAVDVHDIQATLLHCLGIDHKKLTFRFQGRDHRLTDVHGNVVERLLA